MATHISLEHLIYVVVKLTHTEAYMWLILLGILYFYFIIKGNLWGIIVLILCTAVILPGFRKNPASLLDEGCQIHREEYKQGDIYGHYSDPLALLEQKKEREKLELEGRKKIGQ